MKHEKSCGAVVYTVKDGQIFILVEKMRLGHTSIPKGHVENGESEEDTALREIMEETALPVQLDTGFRRTINYSPEPGVSKDVVFFAARALGNNIVPQASEVSQALFLPADDAIAAMTFDSDRETIRAACRYIEKL